MQLILRPYQPSDVESLVKHANNFNISKYLTNKFPFPYEKKDGEAFIQLALSHDPLQIKAIVLNDEVIGSIGVHQLADIYSKSAEMGYWIAEDYWGKGIGTKVCKALVEHCLSLNQQKDIVAVTDLANIGSQKVLIKSGFQRIENLQREDRVLAYFVLQEN